MNSRELFLETCRFGNPSRAYRWECIGPWDSTLPVWEKQGYNAPEGYGEYLKFFDMDENVGFMNFQDETRLFTGFTNTPYFPGFRRKIIKKEGRTRVVRNFNGVVLRELTEASDTSMPQFISFPAETRESWQQVKNRLDPHNRGRYPQDWSGLELRFGTGRDFVLGMPLIGAFGLLRNLMGAEKALIAFYDDPALVEEIMEHWEWLNKGFLDEVSSHLELDYVLLWEDMCFKSGPLISPAMFSRFILPHYKKVMAHAHSKGILVTAVDTDGQCDPLIPLFIEGGINLLFPLEVASGMDPREVRKKYGKAIALMGGIDKRPLTKGHKEIEAEVDSKLLYLFEQGGYLPSLDHTAPPDIPLDNFRYFLDYVRGKGAEYFGKS